MVNKFRTFIMRGSLIDMAVGFTVGAAFTTVAQSLVKDVIMPPIGLAVGRVDFVNLYWLLRSGTNTAPPYPTLADAQAAGAVTLNYGQFINNVITFLIVAIAVFFVIQMAYTLQERISQINLTKQEAQPAAAPTVKTCPYCKSTIPIDATRCPQCTSQLEEAKTAG
jgi:large conductance mechanosensitive channel